MHIYIYIYIYIYIDSQLDSVCVCVCNKLRLIINRIKERYIITSSRTLQIVVAITRSHDEVVSSIFLTFGLSLSVILIYTSFSLLVYNQRVIYHPKIYIYIYIYICVCVCVCTFLLVYLYDLLCGGCMRACVSTYISIYIYVLIFSFLLLVVTILVIRGVTMVRNPGLKLKLSESGLDYGKYCVYYLSHN